MAFYVTVKNDDQRFVLALGPFNRHGDAQRMVAPVRRYVDERFPREAPWVGYGTSRLKSGPATAGKFNAILGHEGRVRELLNDPATQGRWTLGDLQRPPEARPRREPRRAMRRTA